METIFPVRPSDAKQNLLLGESTLDSTEEVCFVMEEHQDLAIKGCDLQGAPWQRPLRTSPAHNHYRAVAGFTALSCHHQQPSSCTREIQGSGSRRRFQSPFFFSEAS